jgi:hypothetical protein
VKSSPAGTGSIRSYREDGIGPIGPQTKVSSVLNEESFLPPGDTARDPSAERDDFPWPNSKIVYPLELYPTAEYLFAPAGRSRLDDVVCGRCRMRREALESLKRRIQSDANLSYGYATDPDGVTRCEASFAGAIPEGLAALSGPHDRPDPAELHHLPSRSDSHDRRTIHCGRRRTASAG